MEKGKTQISINMDTDLLNELKKEAKEQGRPVSNLINFLLKKEIKPTPKKLIT